MADHIFPIVSTTPPPLDFEEDDDDFTDFTEAQNHWATETSEDFTDCPLPEVKRSPIDSPVKKVQMDFEKNLFQPVQIKENLPHFADSVTENSNLDTNGDISFPNDVPSLFNGNIPQDSFASNGLGNSVEQPYLNNNFSAVASDLTETAQSQKFEPERLDCSDESISSDHSQSSNSEYEEPQPTFNKEELNEKCGEQQEANSADRTNSSAVSLAEKFYSANDLLEVTAPKTKTLPDAGSKSENELVSESQNLHVNETSLSETTDNFVNAIEGESQIENDPSVEFHIQKSESESEDDFADFSSFAVAPSLNPVTTKEADDDFADFAIAQNNVNSQAESTNTFAELNNEETTEVQAVDNNGFAEFSETGFSKPDSTFPAFDSTQNEKDDEFDQFADFKTNENTEDDDDFGDFSTSANVENAAFRQPVAEESYHHPAANFGKWFSFSKRESDEIDIFPIHSQMEDDLLEIFTVLDNVSQQNSSHKKPEKPSQIWDLLQDIDNAIALKFLWNQSSHHQHLISSLGIRTQNVLFGKASKPYYVPTYYAAGLGMLEPGKEMIKPMSAAEKITAVSPIEKNFPPDENLKSWSTETANNGVVNGGHACSRDANGGEVMGNSTVLNSVMDASSINLDMLSNTVKGHGPTGPVAEQDKIDPDLLELARDVTPDPAATKKADPLSKILATLGVSSTGSKSPDEDEHLSDEAKKVLKRLPELSYMRSKVLMFPVGKSSNLHH